MWCLLFIDRLSADRLHMSKSTRLSQRRNWQKEKIYFRSIIWPDLQSIKELFSHIVFIDRIIGSLQHSLNAKSAGFSKLLLFQAIFSSSLLDQASAKESTLFERRAIRAWKSVIALLFSLKRLCKSSMIEKVEISIVQEWIIGFLGDNLAGTFPPHPMLELASEN